MRRELKQDPARIDIASLAEGMQNIPEPHFVHRRTGEVFVGTDLRGIASDWVRVPAPPSMLVYNWMGAWLFGYQPQGEQDEQALARALQRHGQGGNGVFRDVKLILSKAPVLRKAWLDCRQDHDRAWVIKILTDRGVAFSDVSQNKEETR